MKNKYIYFPLVLIFTIMYKSNGQKAMNSFFSTNRHSVDIGVIFNKLKQNQLTGDVALKTVQSSSFFFGYSHYFFLNKLYSVQTGIKAEFLTHEYGPILPAHQFGFEEEQYLSFISKNFPLIDIPVIFNISLYKNRNCLNGGLGIEFLMIPDNFLEQSVLSAYQIVEFKSFQENSHNFVAGLIGEFSYKRQLGDQNILKIALNFRVCPFSIIKAYYTVSTRGGVALSSGNLESNGSYWGLSLSYEFIFRNTNLELHY